MSQFKTQEYNKPSIVNVLLCLWVLTCFFLYIFYMWKCWPKYLDSDMSSEMILAETLAEENKLLTSSWNYSTELRFLNNQIVFMPLFKLFSDWHIIRVAGSAICVLIMMWSYHFFVTGTGIKSIYATAIVSVITPYSSAAFAFVSRGTYYIPHLTISFLSFGLIFRVLNSEANKRRNILVATLYLLSFMAGLGGMRQLIILYLPLMLVSLICLNLEDTIRVLFAKCSFISFFVSLIGYMINTKLLSRIYRFFQYRNVNFTNLKWDLVISCVNDILKSLGYNIGNVFSGKIIVQNSTFVVIFCLTAIGLWKGICKYRSGKFDWHVILSIYLLVALALLTLIYTFTSMPYKERYNLPILVFAVPLVTYSFSVFPSVVRWKTVTLLVCLLTASMFLQYKLLVVQDKTTQFRELVPKLINDGYTSGYSTFWNGNVLTELSNGKIDMWVWHYNDQIKKDVSIHRLYKWLQKTSHHNNNPNGKCFILLDKKERNDDTFFSFLDNSNLIYTKNDLHVWGYASTDDMLKDLGSFEIIFKKNIHLKNGKDSNGVRYLNKDGKSYGPYVTLYCGMYEISIEGENLHNASFLCTYDDGKKKLDFEIVKSACDNIVYHIHPNNELRHVEFVVKNESKKTVKLSQISVRKIE